LRIFPAVRPEENRRHGRDVLRPEAQISTGEPGIARLHCRHANCSVFIKHVLREDFSARVIARVGPAHSSADLIDGKNTFFCIRATLNGNRPPYSITCRVISSSPAVNSLNAISSPARIWSIKRKFVEVSTPRFWQFCL